MTLKRKLQLISAAAILAVPGGLILWIHGLGIQDWAESETTIDRAWTIIPTALLVAIVAGVLAARLPTPDGKKDRLGLILPWVAVLLGVLILLSLLNLGIR